MSDQLHLPLLPTGKAHISFSELSTWLECPFKHKLSYVDGKSTFSGNEHTSFGGFVHWGCETFINTQTVPIDEVLQKISDDWDLNSYKDKDKWIPQARGILEDLPTWMDETFPGWSPVAAEYVLYEQLDHLGHPDNFWKGYIDAVIKHKGARGKEITRILDWKTTAWGWRKEKLREFKTNAQAASYKIFWSRKLNVDLKDIRASFVLLKREGKPGARCQLIDVSVGPLMEQKVNKAIDKMLRSVKAGTSMKNKTACRFCEFNDTVLCPGIGPLR